MNGLGKPAKIEFLSRATSYHGSTLGALSLSGSRWRAPFESLLHKYAAVPNAETAEQGAAELEAAILSRGADHVAAFIVEPVQGVGGAIFTPLTLTMLSAVTPPGRRGTVLGAWGGIGGLGAALGPLASLERLALGCLARLELALRVGLLTLVRVVVIGQALGLGLEDAQRAPDPAGGVREPL